MLVVEKAFYEGIAMNIRDGHLYGFDENKDVVDGQFDIPDTVTSFSPGIFSNKLSLVTIKLPAKFNAINQHAFEDCETVKNVILQEGLEKVASDAFINFGNLEHIYVYSDQQEEIDRIKHLFPDDLTLKQSLVKYYEFHGMLEGDVEDMILENISLAEFNAVSLKDACKPYPFYKVVETMRKEALEHLCLEPKISNMFSNRYKGILEQLPDLTLSDISSFLGQDSRYYREAEREIQKQALPYSKEDLVTYQTTLDTIINRYMQLAQEHKKYPHEHEQGAGLEENKDDNSKDTGPKYP